MTIVYAINVEYEYIYRARMYWLLVQHKMGHKLK